MYAILNTKHGHAVKPDVQRLYKNYQYLQTKFQQITLIFSSTQLTPNQVQTRYSCNYHESRYIKKI